MTVFDKKSVCKVATVSNKFRILEKTSPILHSSFIIFSIFTSPKFLRSPFFQTAKLLQNPQFGLGVSNQAGGKAYETFCPLFGLRKIGLNLF